VSEIYQGTGFEVAVIGMAGQFPGARNIHQFWENLKNGVESLSFFSDQELTDLGVNPELLRAPNFVKAKGGVLEEKEYFDAAYFGYTPSEAELMDPQMRLLHENTAAALNDAGYDSFSYNGLIGLYVGASSNFYWEALSTLSGKIETVGQIPASQLIHRDYLSTRISYKLNLKGQSISVNTACSTSLVAIHMACRGLLSGECDMAIAGGVTLQGNNTGYIYQEGLILSPDGHCRAFDAKAQGSVVGEGVGMVVLKPLENALADGDHIYAIVKGSAANNDGFRKVGYAAPSIRGQAEVIQAALNMAEADAESITYVETHGSGTALGDPTEIEALKQAFDTEKKAFCNIGSVKTNIGHLDVAAGVASFIKTVLALKHRQIPPSLNFEIPNPKIDFDNSPFQVSTQLTEWKNGAHPLRAGVSSFGIGGTNAHVVLEEAPEQTSSASTRSQHILTLSAKSLPALDRASKDLAEYLQLNPGINLADVAYTLQVGRRVFPYRRFLVCSNTADAAQAFSAPDSKTLKTFYCKHENPAVIFMFSGLGSQYVNMGLELYRVDPDFRQELDGCFELLQALVDYDVKSVLYPSGAGAAKRNLDEPEVAQPIMFIFEYALAQLLIKWGIAPDMMIGYSFGEYVAACLAGVFSLKDALQLILTRGQLIQTLPAGKMLSVPLPKEKILPLLESLEIAIDNGPSCIVCGPAKDVAVFEEKMKEMRLLCMYVENSHALHSRMMTPILRAFEQKVSQISLIPPVIPYISNVTGNWIQANEATDPHYWSKHLSQTVRFADGVRELLKEDHSIFVEVGPGRALSNFVRQNPNRNLIQLVVNLIRNQQEDISDHNHFLSKIAQLWLYGKNVDWNRCYWGENRHRVALPTYPLERQRFWIDGNHLSKKAFSETDPLQKKADIADWFYVPSWKRTLQPLSTNGSLKSLVYLLFIDDCEVGSALARALRDRGHQVFNVGAGEAFERRAEFDYSIQPEHPESYDRLWNDLLQSGKIPGQIIHLWSLTPDGDEETDFESVLNKGFYSLLYLAKAITKQKVISEIQIDVVTNQLYEVTGKEDLSPAKSTVIGAVRVIPQEYPFLVCRTIDVALPASDNGEKTRLIHHLVQETSTVPSDRVIAYRNQYRWVQIYDPVRLDSPARRPARLRDHGVYLITGGLGNIGFSLARHLIKNVNARLILLGRAAMPAREERQAWLDNHGQEDKISKKIQRIQELEALGGEVLVLDVNVANEEQMRSVIHQAEGRFGSINGVIHAAGNTNSKSFLCPVDQINKTTCNEHFQPKIHALLVLEKVFRNHELDFCILTSSLAPILGGLGFAPYSAANSFMDAFAYQLNRAHSRHWISVNWGDWTFSETPGQTPTTGLNEAKLAMSPEEGMETFDRILSQSVANQIIVSAGSLQHRISKWVQLESLRSNEDTAKTQTTYSRPNLLNPYVAPQTPLEEKIARIWETFFGFEKLGVQDDFFELGGDSLKAMIVLSKIQKELSVAVPITEFFRNPQVEGLAQFINNAEKSTATVLQRAEVKEYYPLSSPQKRLYFFQQVEPDNTAYNEFRILKLDGVLDRARLTDTFKKLIQRHESLRTAFELVDNQPMQKIYQAVDFEIEFFDLQALRLLKHTDEERARRFKEIFVKAFDLARAPLLRVALVEVDKQKSLLLIDIHHIVADGVSHDLLWRDLISLYMGKELPEVKFQYRDFSEWQNSPDRKEAIKKQERYWLEEFENGIPLLNLPTDRPRTSVQRYKGSSSGFELGEEETEFFQQLALEHGATTFMVLLAIVNVLLSKLCGQQDIVIGTPVAGRTDECFENTIGMFANTLALWNYPDGNKSFIEFLQEVKARTLAAFENQDYPFEDLVANLLSGRDLSRHPIFDVMFTLNPTTEALHRSHQQGTSELKLTRFGTEMVRLDLTLLGMVSDKKITLNIEYSTQLFNKKTIEKLIAYTKRIIAAVMANPLQKLSDIEIMSSSERTRLLRAIGNHKNKLSPDTPISEPKEAEFNF